MALRGGGRRGRMSRQLELFERTLPAKPYATDDFAYGLRVLPRRAAIRHRYIEPQPSWLHYLLLFDIDRDASWYAADEAGLPSPSITVVNRRNGHGHLLYGLQVPLRMDTWGGRKAPVRYAETIERAMTAKLRADVSYSGFICKNPLHRHWIVLPSDHLFTLPELHGSSPRRGCAHGTRNVAGPVARRASGAPTLIASGPGDRGSVRGCQGGPGTGGGRCHWPVTPNKLYQEDSGPLCGVRFRWAFGSGGGIPGAMAAYSARRSGRPLPVSGGVARSAGHRGVCGAAQPAGVDCRVVAGAAGLKAADVCRLRQRGKRS